MLSHRAWLLKFAAAVQSTPPVRMEMSVGAPVPNQDATVPATAVQPSLQDRQTAAATQRIPALLTQVAEQLSASAAQEAVSSSADQDQSQLMTAQAAELASARQAMQLMAQLLESMPQPTEQTGSPLAGQAAVSASDLQALLSQSQQQAVTQRQAVDQEENQVIAAQAGELASARQAMQLLAQLLEQEAGSTAVSTSAVQATGKGSSEDAVLREAAVELRLQQALEMMLQAQAGHRVQTQV